MGVTRALVTLLSRVTIAMSFTGLRRSAASLSYLAQSEVCVDTTWRPHNPPVPLVDLDPGNVGIGPHPLILPDVILPDPDIHVASAPAALVETVRCGQDVLSK